MRLTCLAAALLHSSTVLGVTQGETQNISNLTAHDASQAFVAEVARATDIVSSSLEDATARLNNDTDTQPSKNVKRKALTAKQQQAGEDYERKLHSDDDYAKWASDDNLKRGPAHSKLLRSTLYDHPSM